MKPTKRKTKKKVPGQGGPGTNETNHSEDNATSSKAQLKAVLLRRLLDVFECHVAEVLDEAQRGMSAAQVLLQAKVAPPAKKLLLVALALFHPSRAEDEKLAGVTGLSRSTVRRFLRELEDEGTIQFCADLKAGKSKAITTYDCSGNDTDAHCYISQLLSISLDPMQEDEVER